MYTEFYVDGLMQDTLETDLQINVDEKLIVPAALENAYIQKKRNDVLVVSPLVQTNETKTKNSIGVIEKEPDLVKANPFGLKNMLGNVMEYCADKYDPEAYAKSGSSATDPLVTEGTEWVVRGGNYTSDAADLRCASRDYTKHEAWLKTDPQQPKSIWWYSDIRGIGFRVVCEPNK